MKAIRKYLLAPVLAGIVFSFAGCKDDKIDPIDQWRADIKTIDNYLAANSITALNDISGMRFIIDNIGFNDLPPTRGHSVKVTITGRLLGNGQTIQETTTLTIKVSAFEITGLQQAVTLLPEGTSATFYIPSGLAYGPQGTDIVPPNSNLVYDVTLQDVIYEQTELQQLTADTTAINKYLKDNAIDAKRGPFSVRYVISEMGTGPTPSWYDKVEVYYDGKVLGQSALFYSGIVRPRDDFDSRVVDYLRGLQVAFQLFPSGTKATFYIPSVLGFGTIGAGEGSAAVPPNSNVVYEIRSLKIVN